MQQTKKVNYFHLSLKNGQTEKISFSNSFQLTGKGGGSFVYIAQVFDTDDLKIERKNKMYLSNNEIKTLEKYNVNYNNYDSLSSLIFDLNEIEGDDDLEQLAIELSEFNYYNNQNK